MTKALEETAQHGEKLNRLDAVPLIGGTVVAWCKHAANGPFRDKESTPTTYRDHVMFGAVRYILTNATVLGGQWISPSTDGVYKISCMTHGVKQNTIDLGNGAKGHWIGKPDAKYVMLYFHGGGYIQPASTGHSRYQFELQKELQSKGRDFSIFSLSYTLAPHAVYPQQIAQAATALTYLLKARDPSTIIVGGDSAGGNLTAALLMHLARPHPQVPAVHLSKRLHGAFLLSPWVCFGDSRPSMTQNKNTDYITLEALNRASKAYIGPSGIHDNFSEPVRTPADWWRDVADRVVDDVMVWYGGGEILRDGIEAFAANVTQGFAMASESVDADGSGVADEAKGKGRVSLLTTPKASHEHMIINHMLKVQRKHRRQEDAISVEEWLDRETRV